MNPDQLLSQLREVHAPDAVSWWPPAIGWWILAILIIALVIFAIYSVQKYLKKTAWKRQALKEYTLLKTRYQQAPSAATLTEIVVLLRRCAASAKQERQILSQSGESWASILAQPQNCLDAKEIHALAFGHYQPEPPLLDNQALQRIGKWIRRQTS